MKNHVLILFRKYLKEYARSKIKPNMNEKLRKICQENGFHFIDNGNISIEHIWTDGVHLLESGKVIIANNLIRHFNNFLEIIYT